MRGNYYRADATLQRLDHTRLPTLRGIMRLPDRREWADFAVTRARRLAPTLVSVTAITRHSRGAECDQVRAPGPEHILSFDRRQPRING